MTHAPLRLPRRARRRPDPRARRPHPAGGRRDPRPRRARRPGRDRHRRDRRAGHRARVRHRRVRHPRVRPPRGAPGPWRAGGARHRHGLRDGDLAYRINFATASWPEIVDRRVGRDLSSDEAHALADEVNRTLRARRRLLRAASDDRAPRSARDPLRRRRRAVVERHEHRPRVRAPGAPRGRARDVRAGRRDRRRARCVRRSRTSRRAHERVRRGLRPHPRCQRGQRPPARGRGEAARQPDPHARRRRSPPEPRSPSRNGSGCRGGASWRCRSSAASRSPSACSRSTRPASMPPGSARPPRSGTRSGPTSPPTRSVTSRRLYVHIKGPDVPAHDGRAEDKRDVVTAIDRAFFGEVLPRLGRRHASSRSRPTTPPRASARPTPPTPCRCS